jgi:hypothetical protein
MTAILLGHAARRSRPGSTAVTGAINVGRFSTDNNRLIGPALRREPLEPYFGTARPQEFASGFVDFLLGRSARDPR